MVGTTGLASGEHVSSGAFIPILRYHQVSPQPIPAFRDLSVTPSAFASQMTCLAQAGYETITLEALVEHFRDAADLPARPIIVTFDDGFQDCVEYAVPILQEHRFTAIFFLVSGLMGMTSRWTVREVGGELPLMTWPVARQLESMGFHCGSHTVSHRRLTELTDTACREELLRSRLVLEDQLGHEVTHLAYPSGSFNERVETLAAETGYRSACSCVAGLVVRSEELLALPRVNIRGQDSVLDFRCRLRIAHTPGELLWGAGRRARRQIERLIS